MKEQPLLQLVCFKVVTLNYIRYSLTSNTCSWLPVFVVDCCENTGLPIPVTVRYWIPCHESIGVDWRALQNIQPVMNISIYVHTSVVCVDHISGVFLWIVIRNDRNTLKWLKCDFKQNYAPHSFVDQSIDHEPSGGICRVLQASYL